VLDLPVLQRWLASRPPTPFKLPTLSRGIEVRDGEIRDASWSLRALSLDLPHLQSGDPALLHAKGRFLAGKTDLPFELDAIAATPGLASTLDLKLKLQLDGGKTPAGKAAPNPASIALLGHYSWTDALFTLQADKLALDARSPIPSFTGKGKFERGQLAYLDFEAVLERWPEAWPKLPANLAGAGEKLPVHLVYEGKPDFSDVLQLYVRREAIELVAGLRVPELRRWLAADAASPLPPLQGHFKAPSLTLDGVEMQGVEVELSDGGSTKAAP